jgi:tetratricopeptide (TPR) repeat protein
LLRSGNQEEEDWDNLESIAKEFLEKSPQKSYKGFFYYGISLYKLGDYENAIKAFNQAESLRDDDA